MSRQVWRIETGSRYFYVRSYRRLGSLLFYSSLLNVVLIVGITYTHRQQPDRHFYATSGEAAPIELKRLPAPNKTDQPLLPSDPPELHVEKPIPD